MAEARGGRRKAERRGSPKPKCTALQQLMKWLSHRRWPASCCCTLVERARWLLLLQLVFDKAEETATALRLRAVQRQRAA